MTKEKCPVCGSKKRSKRRFVWAGLTDSYFPCGSTWHKKPVFNSPIQGGPQTENISRKAPDLRMLENMNNSRIIVRCYDHAGDYVTVQEDADSLELIEINGVTYSTEQAEDIASAIRLIAEDIKSRKK